MNPNQNKRHIKKVIVLTISLVVLAFSATYAYFTSTFDEPTTTTATAGIFKVESTLETVNAIRNPRMVLLNSDEIDEKADHLDFTVTSTDESTVDGRFDVFLRDIEITRNLKSEDFKWELLQKEDSSSNLKSINTGTFKDIQETDSKEPVTEGVDRTPVHLEGIQLTSTPLSLPKDTTVSLVFRLYILNASDRNQIDLTEGSFQGKLYLEAVPVSEIEKQQSVEPGQP